MSKIANDNLLAPMLWKIHSLAKVWDTFVFKKTGKRKGTSGSTILSLVSPPCFPAMHGFAAFANGLTYLRNRFARGTRPLAPGYAMLVWEMLAHGHVPASEINVHFLFLGSGMNIVQHCMGRARGWSSWVTWKM